MEKSKVQIGLIGRTLVHYRHYKDGHPRVPTQLSSKVALEKYLLENGAVLLEPGAEGRPAPATARGPAPQVRPRR
ncbi:MAG: hypothetical protein ACKVYV_15825 [Limisphaerales bacterium]